MHFLLNTSNCFCVLQHQSRCPVVKQISLLLHLYSLSTLASQCFMHNPYQLIHFIIAPEIKYEIIYTFRI